MNDKAKKADLDLMEALFERIKAAEKKHPDFADGIYQGVGVIGEEYGELCQALNKAQGEDRVTDEALDLLCVAWRFAGETGGNSYMAEHKTVRAALHDRLIEWIEDATLGDVFIIFLSLILFGSIGGAVITSAFF